ncbi:hypothetical protein FJ546_13735 [Mesorhizobium sp. B2-4-19]|uniref:hypothetical protein n=1 Tax=Mesorhizobium sp. B2-4-19 TaxID=2589930 RepID=UPI00112E0E73|nr:hypothetical protein [Mesorhizobium sp. B2-4-19]TPK63776.1 hypothetical protein FJ546_13735 [Mesorhizobium sp. B2-4-19]
MLKTEMRILSACAISARCFCIALSELHFDDPLSIVLIWEEGLQQPWSRIDIQRNVYSITVGRFDEDSEPCFVAMSDEGDVYFLDDRDNRREKIPGAGIHSEDAVGLGSLHVIRNLSGRLVAAGQNAQVYERKGPDDWQRLFDQRPTTETPGDMIDFSTITENNKSGLLLGGVLRPGYQRKEDAIAALKAGNSKLYAQLVVRNRRVNAGCLYSLHDEHWRNIDLPTNSIVRDLISFAGQQIFLAADGGLLLEIRGDDEVGELSAGTTTEPMLSLTNFQNTLFVASRSKIFQREGDDLAEVLRDVPPEFKATVRLQGVGHMLWLFDSIGVARFDGTNWTEIEIPPELLRPTFRGLQQPQ